MVAAIAIDHLCKEARSKNIGIAYLFCNHKAQLKQTLTALLAEVLKQLVQSRPDVAAPVTQMYEKHKKQRSRPSHNKISGALQSACSAYSTIYLIIDTLDECANQDRTTSRLINKLRELQAKPSIRLMFTSHFIPEVTEFQPELTLEVRASDHDVRRYIAGQVSRLPWCAQLNGRLAYDV
jgi:hypothetical protein